MPTLFKPVVSKAYTLSINATPSFGVTVNKSTLVKDYDTLLAKLTSNPVNGICFKIKDKNTLEFSLTPGNSLAAETDKEFRGIIAKVSSNSLTSLDADDIVNQYNRFLQDNNLESAFSPKSHKQTSAARPSPSTVF
jgi:hypothetical protein